jgi:cytochrome P450
MPTTPTTTATTATTTAETATTTVRRPPGPKGLPIIGNLRAVKTDLVGFLEASMHEYGEIFHVPVGPHHFYQVANPDYARHVLVTNAANYTKGRLFAKAAAVLGGGLVISEGEVWRSQRRLMQPQFHRDAVRQLGTSMIETIGDVIGRWRPIAERAEIVDFLPEMSRLTSDVVSRTLFSEDVDRDAKTVSEAIKIVVEHTNNRWYGLIDLTDILPTRAHRDFHEAVATLRSIVTRIIQARRGSAEKKPDLLQVLLDACDPETGEGMSDQQLRDEVMTLFLAGHETTASALAWTWYLLANNPVVDRALRNEIARVVGDRTPTMDDLANLTYPRQVFEETLRMYPPARGVYRDAVADDVIGGYRIPAGSTVIVSTYLIHRNPRLWENPGGFDPERFAPGQPPRHQFAYLPFGAGARKCIGLAFAMLEATLAITMIAQAVRPELIPGLPVKPASSTIYRPAALQVRLLPAKPAATPQPAVSSVAPGGPAPCMT